MKTYKYEEYINLNNPSAESARSAFSSWESTIYSIYGKDWIYKVRDIDFEGNYYNFKLAKVAKIWQGHSFQTLASAGTPNKYSYSGQLVGNTVYLKEKVELGEPATFNDVHVRDTEPYLYLGFTCDTVEEARKMAGLVFEYERLKRHINEYDPIALYKYRDETIPEFKPLKKTSYVVSGIVGGTFIATAVAYFALRFSGVIKNIGGWAWLFFLLGLGLLYLGYVLTHTAFQYKKENQEVKDKYDKQVAEIKSVIRINEEMKKKKAELPAKIKEHNEDVKKFASALAATSDYPEEIEAKYLEYLTYKTTIE